MNPCAPDPAPPATALHRDEANAFALLASRAHLGVLRCDAEGIVLHANDALLSLARRRREALVGGPVAAFFRDALPPADGELRRQTLTLEPGGAVPVVVAAVEDEGSLVLVVMPAWGIACRDGVERQVALLATANEGLRQFAYTVAHDLKDPLRGIQLLSEWITEETPSSAPRFQDLVQLLGERVRRLQHLVQGGLQVALRRAPEEIVDVEELVRDTFDLLAPDPARFTLEAHELPRLRTGRFALGEVLLHLLGNTLHHARGAHVRVRVSACRHEGHVRFTVADEGERPSEAELLRIDLSLETPPHPRAVGGLASVRRIVEARGGQVMVPATPRGTAITFSWPTA